MRGNGIGWIAWVAAGIGLAAGPVPRPVLEPWPGETWAQAVDLTYLNAVPWRRNLSGVHWNPQTGHLWLANNSGLVTRLQADGTGGFLKARDYPVGGDLEAITQIDEASDAFCVLEERAGQIREYGIEEGRLRRTWDLTAHLGRLKNDGPEGLAFIPDAALERGGFRDGEGRPYPRSRQGAEGLGGIFLVAVQAGSRADAGFVYAFDPRHDGTVAMIGRYRTARRESCELAYDRESGYLYILHNIDGNTLEVVTLDSESVAGERSFRRMVEIRVPSESNIEGFSLGAPGRWGGVGAGLRWCFLADDDNREGALRWFTRWIPPRQP